MERDLNTQQFSWYNFKHKDTKKQSISTSTVGDAPRRIRIRQRARWAFPSTVQVEALKNIFA